MTSVVRGSATLSCLASHKWDAFYKGHNLQNMQIITEATFFLVFNEHVSQTKSGKNNLEKSDTIWLKTEIV